MIQKQIISVRIETEGARMIRIRTRSARRITITQVLLAIFEEVAEGQGECAVGFSEVK